MALSIASLQRDSHALRVASGHEDKKLIEALICLLMAILSLRRFSVLNMPCFYPMSTMQ
jgi:hypothetical protein